MEIFLLLSIAALGASALFSVSESDSEYDRAPNEEGNEDLHENDVSPQSIEDQLQVHSMSELNWEDVNDDGIIPDVINLSHNNESDNFDASEMQQGLIYIGEGDTLYGSDHSDEALDFAAVAVGQGEIQDGEAGNLAILRGDGGVAYGNAGDDTIMSDEGSAQIFGGSGNDQLYSNGNGVFDGGAEQNASQFTDKSTDTIWGGVGNDTLHLGEQDEGNGGDGEDNFYLYGTDVTLLDFEPQSDKIVVYLNEIDQSLQQFQPSEVANRITLSGNAETLKIFLDETPIFEIPESNDLRVVVSTKDGENFSFVSLTTETELEHANIYLILG